MGEDMHNISIEQQHKSFVLVHKHLERAKKRRAKYANRNTKLVTFEVGDPVFSVVDKKKCKLNLNWQIGWRIV